MRYRKSMKRYKGGSLWKALFGTPKKSKPDLPNNSKPSLNNWGRGRKLTKRTVSPKFNAIRKTPEFKRWVQSPNNVENKPEFLYFGRDGPIMKPQYVKGKGIMLVPLPPPLPRGASQRRKESKPNLKGVSYKPETKRKLSLSEMKELNKRALSAEARRLLLKGNTNSSNRVMSEAHEIESRHSAADNYQRAHNLSLKRNANNRRSKILAAVNRRLKGDNSQYNSSKKQLKYYIDYNKLARMLNQIDYESKTKYPKNKILVDLSKLLKTTGLALNHKLFIAEKIVKMLNSKFTNILNFSTPEFKFVSKKYSKPPKETSTLGTKLRWMLNAIDYRVDELPGKADNSIGERSLKTMLKMIEEDIEQRELPVKESPRTLSPNNRNLRLKYLNKK